MILPNENKYITKGQRIIIHSYKTRKISELDGRKIVDGIDYDGPKRVVIVKEIVPCEWQGQEKGCKNCIGTIRIEDVEPTCPVYGQDSKSCLIIGLVDEDFYIKEWEYGLE